VSLASPDLITRAIAVSRRHIESGSTPHEQWRAIIELLNARRTERAKPPQC
jgi:hypothetical protein